LVASRKLPQDLIKLELGKKLGLLTSSFFSQFCSETFFFTKLPLIRLCAELKRL